MRPVDGNSNASLRPFPLPTPPAASPVQKEVERAIQGLGNFLKDAFEAMKTAPKIEPKTHAREMPSPKTDVQLPNRISDGVFRPSEEQPQIILVGSKRGGTSSGAVNASFNTDGFANSPPKTVFI